MSKKKDKDKLKKAIKKQRDLKLVTSKAKNDPPIDSFDIPDFNPPQGFRAVSINQALQEYSEPIMKKLGSEDMDSLNKCFTIVMPLWNYVISLEDGNDDIQLRQKAMQALKSNIDMTTEEAEDFVSFMINRKNFLMPQDIQPPLENEVFIRKEVSHIIRPFDYSTIDISNSPPILPDAEDIKLIDKIRQMDKNIINNAEYDSFEKFCIDMEQECSKRFGVWLVKKGINEELAKNFSFNIEFFLSFVYRYIHEDFLLLESVSEEYLEDFFFGYLLRNLMAKPQVYILFLPTLKLFYKFLAEMQYIESPEPVIEMLDYMEPQFIEELRERYS